MLNKFWQASLTRRVVVTLACSMVVFWLLSEVINFYYHYSKAETEVREDLAQVLDEMVEERSHHHESAQVRVNSLLRLWRELYTRERLLGAQDMELKHSVFVPFEGARVDPGRIEMAGRVIEVFGNDDPDHRAETFLLVPGQGVFFYRPVGRSAADMRLRMQGLQSHQYNSLTSGNHWGAAFADGYGHLRSAVTAVDLYSGITVGQLLPIDGFRARKGEYSYILRDIRGTHLWSDVEASGMSKGAVSDLPACGRGAMHVADSIVECRQLKGPPWQLLAIVRSDVVMSRALSQLGATVPWTLLVQLLLLVVFALVVQRQLGRPLQRIIELIQHPGRFTEVSALLPEGRTDELGCIAVGYNSLLKTLNAQHHLMADKVRCRTRELERVKRSTEWASHRKSEHLISISHEIRTPLNGIVGALNLLECGRLSEQQRDLIGTARQCSDFLLSLISNLLDFSRIEVGRLELSPERTAILPMLDQALLTIHLRAQEKGLALRTLVAADVPQSMVFDRVRVQQILINLLANAVKFTTHGEVCVGVERQADMLAITVRDTGKGIPEDRRRAIFMPFIQVWAHDNGSGLGLAIASRLARLMGGEIRLFSEVGVGSTFTLLLPIREPDGLPLVFSARLPAPLFLQQQLSIWGIEVRAGDSPLFEMPELAYLPDRLAQKVRAILFEEALTGTGGGLLAPCPWVLKVLIVDDIPTNREIICKMLQALGHEAIAVSSGKEALHYGRMRVFDWVLMDLRMPDMDGIQVARLWRDRASGILDPGTPIMALTANALPANKDCERAGMNGYLTKPLSLERLADAGAQVVSLQLVRGIDLTPNCQLQQPFLDLADTDLCTLLYETLEQLYQEIEVAWRTQEQACLLRLLHTLKGCAGQGGLSSLHEWGQDQEVLIGQGRWPGDDEISHLERMIRQQA